MEKASMYIFGMSCAGCVASVKNGIGGCTGRKTHSSRPGAVHGSCRI